ncbi:HK97 gp10 family phage protein [Agrobacterium tumefaciens]|uniref:HK97-gp10 family putative phage morphogenesis protein n=1 Tax=Agrobacterium tumefaciens TaxID=358 RepID=UPI001573B65F|nr:HK97-gp10 family putative phage morphogenesis protein [Agrobacterium tumefaciens]NSZ83438.1 HK97 gp10 family phage protein [Agrobacterium tumefaciens]WCA69649.1 HK97 gp10 family phage protein [Agrobacterium tumefaciens]
MARRTLEGWDRLKRRLEKIPKAVREQTQPAITSAAQDVAAVMKALAPVDDGDLKDSIEVTPGGQKTPPHSQPGRSTVVPANAAMITAGNSKVRYAHLVEFGTRAHLNGGQFAGTKNPGSRAQPYFFSGFRLAQKKAAAKIKRAMSKAVRSKKK